MTGVLGALTRRRDDSARTRLGFDFAAATGLVLSVLAAVTVVRRCIQAIGAVALEGVENQRRAVEELASSRARIQAAADDERRRIERDLHDGAQQRLVALRVRLALAADLMRDDPMSGPQLLDELGVEAEQALEEVRALAHGVYPSELVEFGLEVALKDLGALAPVRTTVAAEGIGRFSPEIEAAVYFCCLEAVQNAAAHAQGADAIEISIAAGRDLRFEIRDNGSGFSAHAISPGAGFVSMHDRLAAVDGQLDIRAEPGGGARVVGTIALPLENVVYLEAEGREHAAG